MNNYLIIFLFLIPGSVNFFIFYKIASLKQFAGLIRTRRRNFFEYSLKLTYILNLKTLMVTKQPPEGCSGYKTVHAGCFWIN